MKKLIKNKTIKYIVVSILIITCLEIFVFNFNNIFKPQYIQYRLLSKNCEVENGTIENDNAVFNVEGDCSLKNINIDIPVNSICIEYEYISENNIEKQVVINYTDETTSIDGWRNLNFSYIIN